MMNKRCHSCKHYCKEFKREYHGYVEGCSNEVFIKWPCCYEKKEEPENGSVGSVQ